MKACSIKPALIPNKDGVLEDPILYNDLMKMTDNNRDLSLTLYRMVDLDFIDKYGAKLTYDTLGNPTIPSLLKIPEVKYIFDRNTDDVLLNLNKQYKSGIYSYDDAVQRVGAFNRNKNFNEDYLGTITEVTLGKDRGKMRFIIVKNSPSERRVLEGMVRQRTFRDKLMYVLSNVGVNVKFVDELLELEPGVKGVYSTLAPERVFDSLYNVIKILNKSENRELTESEKLSILKEETGHLIVGIAENNPRSRLLFTRLMNLIKRCSPEDIRNVLKATGHYTQEKAEEVINDTLFSIEGQDDAYREAAGRILAGLLDKTSSLLKHKRSYDTGKITRGVAATALGVAAVPIGLTTAVTVGGALGAATGMAALAGTIGAALYTLSWKVRNALHNILKLGAATIKNEHFDLEGAIKKDEIIREAKLIALKFMNLDLGTVLDAIKSPEELHHQSMTEARVANRLVSSFKTFIRTLLNSGLTPKEKRALYELIDSAVSIKNVYTKQGKKLLNNSDTVDGGKLYIKKGYYSMIGAMLSNIRDLVLEMQDNLLEQLKYDNFRGKLANGELAKIPDLNLRIKYLTLLLALIRMCTEAEAILNSVRGKDSGTIELMHDFHIDELLHSIRNMIEPIMKEVNAINRETFAATMATVNGGHNYIETSKRLMRDRKTKQIYISDEVAPGYESNRATLAELLEGLGENGVSLLEDASAWGLWCQKMGASIDVINLLVSNLYDFNKAEANKEMYRYSLLLLDLHERIKHDLDDEDTTFMCETNKDGLLTGNIVQPNYDYGSWEDAYYSMIAEEKKAFREANKDALSKMTEFQRGEALYDYLQPIIEEWHKLHSLKKPEDYIDELFEDTGFEEEGPRLEYLPGKEFASDLWSKLSEKQKEFVKEYISIKQSLDNFVSEYHPESITSYRLPQFRDTTISRMRHKSTYVPGTDERNRRQRVHDWLMNHNSGYRTLHDKFIENFFEDALDEDFGDNSCYNSEDDTFFEGASLTDREYLRRVPVYGVNKLKDMHNLSTNLIYSTMQYAAMAINVHRMATTASILINGLTVLKNRTIGGSIEETKASEQSYVYRRYIKFLEMQVFNIRSNKFAIMLTKNGRTLLANKIMSWMSKEGSWWLLAGKIASGAVNTGTGFLQICSEAAIGDHFTNEELWGSMKDFFTDGGIVDYIKYATEANVHEGLAPLNRPNKYYSFIRYYDSLNNNESYFRDFASHIQLGKWSQLRRVNWAMWVYESGNHFMLTLPYRLKGKHTKLYKLKEGVEPTEENLLDSENFIESGNVWDNFDEAQLQRGENVQKYREKREKKTGVPYDNEAPSKFVSEETETGRWGNPYLDNYYIKNPDGSFIPFDRIALSRFQTQCRYMTDNMHGIYNNPDALALSLSVLGASILTMKKYLFGYADKLFLTDRYSVADGRNTEGAAITWLKLLSYYHNNGDLAMKTKIYSMGVPILVSFGLSLFGNSQLLTAASALAYNFMVSGRIAKPFGKSLGFNLIQGIQNQMELDGIAKYQRDSIKRFDTYMRLALMLRVVSMLLSNSLWGHGTQDDEDKEVKLTWGELADANILKMFGYDNYEEALKVQLTTKKGELKDSPKDPGILYTIVEDAIKNETDELKAKRLRRLRYSMGMAYYFLHRWQLESETLYPFDLNLQTVGEAKTQLAQYSNLFPIGPSFMWGVGEALISCFEPTKPVNYKYDKEAESLADLFEKYGDWDEEDIPDIIYAIRTGLHMIAGDNKGFNKILQMAPYLNSVGVFEDMYKGATSYDFGRKMTTH